MKSEMSQNLADSIPNRFSNLWGTKVAQTNRILGESSGARMTKFLGEKNFHS